MARLTFGEIARWITPRGVAAAAPQLVAAFAYLAVWISPLSFPPSLLKILMMGMVVEFLVIHSFAFMGLLSQPDSNDPRRGRLRRTWVVVGFGAFYLGFAAALSLAFKSSSPLWTFSWLVVSRLASVWLGGESSFAATQRALTRWGLSVLLYILGVVLTSILPLPRLGLTPEVVATLGIPGSGLWVDSPQKLLAFGALYFGLLALDELAYVAKSSEAAA